MIALASIGYISPIFLTVLLIIVLMMVELGSEESKEKLLPFVIVLTAVFLIGVIKYIMANF